MMKVIYDYFRIPATIGPAGILVPKTRGKPVLSSRYYRSKPNFKPSPKGGAVRCRIFKSERAKHPIAVGIAECSMSDNFSYKVGRAIALTRAKHELPNRLRSKF